MLRNRYFLFIIVVGLFFADSISCSVATDKFPRAVVEIQNVNAGTVVEGADIRHTFLLQNKGEAPLLISRAETDCSCTEISHDEVVLPDRNCYLRTVFHTKGQIGEQVKIIHIHSNDPEHPEMELTIRAEVLPAVTVEPNRVFLNGLPGGKMDQTVVVRAPEGTDFDLALKQSHLSKQIGFYLEKTELNNVFYVHFKHKGETPETFRGRTLFSTNIPHQPIISIPVYVRILKELSVIPSRIDFGRLKLSDYLGSKLPNPGRSVNLRSADGIPPKIEILELDNDYFVPSIRYITSLGVTRIELTALIRKFDKGQYNSKVKISLPGQEQVTVPVQIDIR